MEKIRHKGKLVALLVRGMPEGSVPATEPEEPLQLLTLKYPKGKVVAPHLHTSHKRMTTRLQECLIVLKGKLRASLYDARGQAYKRVILKPHDVFVIFSGGHGVEFLENSEVVELKNGPFKDDKKFLA